jgi:hypothetical protein
LLDCLLPQRRGAAGIEPFSEEKEAIKLLKRRVQDLGRGIVGTKEERVTFEKLVEDLKNDYKVNGKRSLDNVELSIRHLSEVFA